jgi:hypothetical protein
MSCKIIFKLDNGEEYIDRDEINKVLDKFPNDIIKTMEPIFLIAKQETKDWNTSLIIVYQNGTYDVQLNLPPNKLFNSEL